jgi:hypothetical protein
MPDRINEDAAKRPSSLETTTHGLSSDIDPFDYLVIPWEEYRRHLLESDDDLPKPGPEGVLLHQLDRAFMEFASIWWDTAPLYQEMESELRGTIEHLFTSIE